MSQKGFSLLEVLVALAIVSTVMVVFAGRLGSSADLQHEMRLRSQALEIAMGVLERSRVNDDVRAAKQGEVEAGGVHFEWSFREEAGSMPGLLHQQVTVVAPQGIEIRLSRDRAAL